MRVPQVMGKRMLRAGDRRILVGRDGTAERSVDGTGMMVIRLSMSEACGVDDCRFGEGVVMGEPR